MADSYDTHKTRIEAAIDVPPADWQPIEFFPHLHQFGEVAAFRAEVNRQSFVFYAKLTRSEGEGVDAWTISQVTPQNGHRQPVVGPFKSWRHCRDAFWPVWRRMVLDLQDGATIAAYGADVFNDPKASESDLVRVRFVRGDDTLVISPDFDRDERDYTVTGVGQISIAGVRASAGSTSVWTANGGVFDSEDGRMVQQGTVIACTVTSEDRSGSTVYVFTWL